MSIADKLTQIAEKQQRVYDAGFSAGQAQGGGGSYDQGYTDGQKAEYDRFWDAFQNNGQRDNYQNAFANWNDESYKPKYTIQGNLINVFQNSTITDTKVAIVSGVGSTQNAFYRCTELVTIESLDITGSTNTSNMFYSCHSLVNVTFTGEIRISVGFPNSNQLSDTSVQSIIDHLADLTGQTAQTLTLHKTVGGKLTDAQKSAISAKNWNVSY